MKKILYSIILGGVILTGCSKDFLEKTPEYALETSQAISNIDDAEVAVNGMYSALLSSDYYGRNFMVVPDVMADNTRISADNSGRFLTEYQYSIIATSGNPRLMWNICYDAIDRSNNILGAIDNLNASTEEKNRVKGEALMMRAFVHFDLVRMYAQPYNLSDAATADGADGNGGHLGVPYMLKSEIGTPARETVNVVYTNIISDLTEAETLLPVVNPKGVKFRFHKMAAKAMLARVYLYKDDFANAKKYADEVVNSGVYPLVPSDLYVDSWSVRASDRSETIFSLSFLLTDYPSTNALGYIYLPEGYGDLFATQDIIDKYDAGDIRLGLFYQLGNDWVVNKYPGRDGTPGLDDSPVIRSSEMYLTIAEAAAKGAGTTTEALAALNKVYKRANPDAADISLSGQALIDRIIEERSQELAYEGHRIFDLNRNKKSLDRVDITTPDVVSHISYPPQREIDVNSNMIQNKGY
jgi:hypothetical protein